MTEQEWLASTDPAEMLRKLTHGEGWHAIGAQVPPSERKLRLLACACCRQVWDQLTEERSRQAVEVAEKFADGLATIQELGDSYAMANAAFRQACANPHIPGSTFDMELVYKCCAEIRDLVRNSGLPRWFSVSNKHAAFQADLLRHIVGNPWRPMRIPKYQAIPGESPERWADPRKAAKIYQEIGKPSWQTPLVLDLAQQLYDGRDVGPILHDALIDAGAPDGLVEHFAAETVYVLNGRIAHRVGHEHEPHPKGCWALDLILGKE